MEKQFKITIRVKKRSKPTVREMNTSLYSLRAFQIGLSMADMDQLEMGDVMDMITESANDYYDYPLKATQEDIDRMFGG